MVINDKILVELKATEDIIPAYRNQTLNYLKATQIEVGLLLSFGEKPKFERFIRPSGLRFKKAHITHPELKTTFNLDILGVKKNP